MTKSDSGLTFFFLSSFGREELDNKVDVDDEARGCSAFVRILLAGREDDERAGLVPAATGLSTKVSRI